MPIFEYIALNPLGRRERGTVEAESVIEARRKLRAARVHVVDIGEEETETHKAPPLARRKVTFRRVKPRELAAAIRQLATLLRSGMPLVPALGALVEQLSGRPLAKVIARVRDRVNEGSTFAAAVEEHPRVFSRLFVNMVRTGEATGALENILVRVADMMERRVSVTNKVKTAMVYPTVVAIVGAGAIIFLLARVVPSITKIFLDLNRTLPWPTLFLISVSDFVRRYFLLMLLAVAVIVLGLRIWIRTSAGRLVWDRLKLKLPIFGDVILKMAVSRFSRTLGVLLASGVSILDALDIVKRVVGNAVLAQVMDKAKENVGQGDSIAGPIRRSGVFPPIVYHMIAVGEASGNIEEGLFNVADAYDEEVEASVQALTALLEPLMILVMGGVVGFIALAILLPIFDINKAIY
jgi:general secretion pathway protein F